MKTVFSAVLLLALSFFAGSAEAQIVYERGNSAEPVTLDPQKASTAAEGNILRDIYEGLLVHGPDGTIVLGVAESFEVSDDGLTYVFHLRNSNWSDGTAVTAADFVHAFRRLLDPAVAAPDAPLFAAIAGADQAVRQPGKGSTFGVRAIDDATLEITLASPIPAMLALLARPSTMPVHRDHDTVAFMPAVTGPFNGAFRFDGFVPGDGLWLIRNSAYYGAETIAIDTVIYRAYDIQQAIRAFEDGTLLSNNDVPVFGLDERREELGDDLRRAPFNGSYFYVANLGGVLADARIRRAAALAIDRNRINADIWAGAMIPTRAIVPDGIPAYPTPATVDLGPNDHAERVAAARALLAEAGYGPDNQPELVIAIVDTELNRATAAAIVANLAEVGIVATVIERDAETHYAAVTGTRDYDLASVAWIGDTDHASAYLGLFDADGPRFADYANPEYDALLAEAAITRDGTVVRSLYEAADRFLVRDLPAIPILQYAALNLVSPRLAGWQDNAADIHLSRWMSITPAE